MKCQISLKMKSKTFDMFDMYVNSKFSKVDCNLLSKRREIYIYQHCREKLHDQD